ncbi:(Fe-S)-binding protein [Desulfosarcina cetonica]|uniref:(Fe-S)-binding protein n=1 Tax=Desulfosarcina cetonica TaxID=90730 RepID=UPI0006D00E0A|nr:(Fe-S)-binding protein [Desulfosarcina cetonica]
MEKLSKSVQPFLEQCSRCGACVEQCHHLQAYAYESPADIAAALTSGDLDESLTNIVLECSLCGLCHQVCPEELDFKQLVLDARCAFVASGITDSQRYRFLWVDYDWCLFSIFRDTYGLDDCYAHLMKASCDVLFFPGCMLLMQGHRIVESVCQWLAKSGDSVAMLTECCGAPLLQMGQPDRFKSYTETLWRTIKAKGPRQIVTACPTCHAQLVEGCDSADHIEIISLYQLMAESGLRAKVLVAEAQRCMTHAQTGTDRLERMSECCSRITS